MIPLVEPRTFLLAVPNNRDDYYICFSYHREVLPQHLDFSQVLGQDPDSGLHQNQDQDSRHSSVQSQDLAQPREKVVAVIHFVFLIIW